MHVPLRVIDQSVLRTSKRVIVVGDLYGDAQSLARWKCALAQHFRTLFCSEDIHSKGAEMRQYCVNCDCGAKNLVSSSQAGGVLTCYDCSREVQVRSLSKLAADQPKGPLPARAAQTGKLVSGGRTKLDELGIFTIGIGVLSIILPLLSTFELRPDQDADFRSMILVISLVFGSLLIALGILVRRLKNPKLIYLTMAIFVAGSALDILGGLHPIRTVISLVILALIIQTGRAALAEVSAAGE